MKSDNHVNVEHVRNQRASRLKCWTVSLIKGGAIFSTFILLSQFFKLLSTINGTNIPAGYYSEPMPTILGLLDSEFFMGVIFVITLTVLAYVLYLLWQLHEIAVHKSEKINSHQANLVFALSLCGLFLHKAWWVLAVIIAFTNWHAISNALSKVIHNGIYSTKSDNKQIQKDEA
ncbi:magnesium transporter [Shewanella gaetbuli]